MTTMLVRTPVQWVAGKLTCRCDTMIIRIRIIVVMMMNILMIVARKMTTLVRIPVQCIGRNTDLPDLGLPISNQ